MDQHQDSCSSIPGRLCLSLYRFSCRQHNQIKPSEIFDIRKHVLEYDDVMNRQREVTYRRRREALGAES
ncbi:MAG: hypothetical protein HGA72_01725, partial [Chlorobiaceae bacterium]|nr:hypothetical protein [Chlorobiaceae bacterium]